MIKAFEKYMTEFFKEIRHIPEPLFSAIRYSMENGGKRIRPRLVFMGAELMGLDYTKVLNTALAIEMIHTYSLIHDDMPCMDNDDMRRGKPTCHKVYGENIALLAGDALLNMAYEILSENKDNLEEGTALKIIKEVSALAGTHGMVSGQCLDLHKPKKLTEEYLEKLHSQKTGALIAASLLAGAIAGKADDKTLDRLKAYAFSIGHAFQITDDILDNDGYVTLFGIDAAKKIAKENIDHAVGCLDTFSNNAELVAFAKEILLRKK